MGSEFIKNVDFKNIGLIGEEQLLFPASAQGSRDLKTDDGQEVFMKGKKYFFVFAPVKNPTIDISQTEFEEYRWLNYKDAVDMAESIYQKGKQRVTLKALDFLHDKKLIN